MRHRLEAYLDKVFDFSRLVDELPEGRQYPRHPWHKVFDAVFLGAAMQIPSLLQIQAECRSGALSKRIGRIGDDTLGYALQRQSAEPVFDLGCEIARRLKRNGVLHSAWSRGLIVATVIVSTPFPIPLGLRFQQDGEAEVPCALALWQDLVDRLGRRFLDLLVGDAIYLQAPFVKEVERLGLDWAFPLKENQPELLREAERFTAGPPAGVQAEAERELRWWHLPEVDWPAADRCVRVVKTVRTDHKRQVTVSQEGAHRKKVRARWRWRAPTSTPPISNSAPSRRCSSIN